MKSYSFNWLEKAGRLGNQLFQLSWVFAKAKKNAGTPCFKHDWLYRNVFKVPEEFYRNPPKDSIDGGTYYYQELRYFEGYDGEIKKMFQPSSESDTIINNHIKEYIEDMIVNGCSVHHRLGDYLEHPDSHPVCTSKYYNSSMRLVLNLNPNTIFYVFSDGMDVIKKQYNEDLFRKNLIDSNQIIFCEGIPECPVEVHERIGEQTDWIDMFSMSKCKNHIIANSTFSWWSAFLSMIEGRTYYPSVWFGTKNKHVPWELMIPKEWVKVLC